MDNQLNTGLSDSTKPTRQKKPGSPSQRSFSFADLPLATQLIILVSFLVGLIVLGVTALSANRARTAATTQVTEQFGLHAGEVAKEIELWLESGVNQIQTLALDDTIANALDQKNNSYLNSEGQALDEATILEFIGLLDQTWRNGTDSEPLIVNTLSTQNNPVTAVLSRFGNNFGDHVEVFVTDRYGATVGSTGRLSDYYQADEGWWQAAWNEGQGGVFISDIEFDESAGVNSLQIATPVYKVQADGSEQMVGVIRTTYITTQLNAIVNAQQFGETGYLLLYNAEGTELLNGRPDAETGKLSDSTVNEAITKTEGTDAVKDSQGKDVLLAFSNVSLASAVPNWTLITRQNSSEALAVANQIFTNGIWATLIALGLAVLASVLLARSFTRPVDNLVKVAEKVGQGDLSELVDYSSENEIGTLASTFNTTILQLRESNLRQEEEAKRNRALQENISEFLDVAMDIADGDFTKRGEVTDDVLGNVIDAINVMVDELGDLLSDVRTAATSVNDGSNKLLATTKAINETTQQQASVAVEAGQDVQEVTQSMRHVTQDANASAQAATQALQASQQGREAVTNTLEGMQNIRREVQSISKRIKSLGDRSLEISEVVDTISSIASQTNLLALNASIEASGAGEAGSRFAVVADEVRKLAEDASKATERVASLIKNVQAEVQEVVASVEDGTREVEQGYRVASEAGQRLEEISSIVEESAKFAQSISTTMQDQLVRVEQVGSSVQTISGMATESQETVNEGRSASEELQALAGQLSESLSRFRLAN